MKSPLFDSATDHPESKGSVQILNRDGNVDYLPSVFDPETCSTLLSTLLDSLDWRVDELYMFGKLITTKRKVAWIGDEGCAYTYSGVKKYPLPWSPELLVIKAELEKISGWKFNSCLLNLYHDGTEGMGWHSDDEPELEQTAPIASLSLGGERKFSFKHKLDKETTSLVLENGSVLIMHAPTQQHWQHSLTKTKLTVGPRINLTFRVIRV
jgi:alkylated DNA repair dioxygenase AlkB